MYILDGIAYSGNRTPELKVSGVKPMDNYLLWVRFNNGEAKVFDFKPLLEKPAYAALKDIDVFKGVYIDYGIPVWNDGDIGISPEYLYENVQNERITA